MTFLLDNKSHLGTLFCISHIYYTKNENLIIKLSKPTKNEFIANVAVSMGSLTNDDTWYIITNANPKTAIRQYNKRFGSIETIFKNAKSNGFYLETGVRSLFAFNNIFGLGSICISWMVIIGSYVNKISCFYSL